MYRELFLGAHALTRARFLCFIAILCGALAVGESSVAEIMGEGYSATTEKPARYMYRAFTVPDVPRICDAAPPATHIEFAKTTMTLEVGDTFGLADLPSATALDADGAVAEAVPVNISVYIDRASGHTSIDWCGEDQKWHVLAPGRVEVTVNGACRQDHDLRATLTIVIPAPSSEKPSSAPATTEVHPYCQTRSP